MGERKRNRPPVWVLFLTYPGKTFRHTEKKFDDRLATEEIGKKSFLPLFFLWIILPHAREEKAEKMASPSGFEPELPG